MAGPAGARREDLAELLWGPGRLANLRQELYAIRKLPGADEWLADTGEVVSVRAETDVQDLHGRPGAVDQTSDPPLDIELLPGLERSTTPSYQDWLGAERARLEADWIRLQGEEIARLEASGNYADALRLVDVVLARDELDEHSQRAGIRLAYRLGDPSAALARFDALHDALRRELGVEPTPETLQLVELIRERKPLATDVTTVQFEPRTERLAQVLVLAEGQLGVAELASVVELPADAVAADLAGLERDGWLNQHLMLKSALARRISRELPVGTKGLLHQRIAAVLSAGDSNAKETIARHLLRAGKPEAAAPLLLAAARDLIERSAPAEAVPLLLRASWAAFDKPELRLDANVLLEGCAAQLADEKLQEAALSQAEGLAWELQSDRWLAEVKMRRSRVLLRKGAVGEGLERALEALAIGNRLDDERLVARARNAIGGAQFYSGDLQGAEASFRLNLTAEDPVERYRAFNNLGSIAGIHGNLADALPLLEEALTLGRANGQIGDVMGTLNNLAATADRVGDYRRAVKYFKESLTLARRAGSVSLEGQILVNLAVVYGRLGELGPAWNTAIEVEEIALQTSDTRLAGRAKEQQAEVASLCGDRELALTGFSAAAAAAHELGDQRKIKSLAAQLSVATVQLEQEGFAAALSAVGELSGPDWADVTPWLLVELALLTSDAETCGELLARAATSAAPSRHLKLLFTMAEMRAGLLDDATAAQRGAAQAAQRRLLGDDEDSLAGFECVEMPHALLLADLTSRYLLAGRASSGGTRRPSSSVMTQVRAALEEQGSGLPRHLVGTLLQRPDAWLAGLTDAD